MAIWDDIVLPEDREAYEKYRSHSKVDFGKKPGVLVIDMTYSFVDDNYSTGCSRTGKPCVKNIFSLLQVARAKGIPVIYTKGSQRITSAQKGLWKAGGNYRTDKKINAGFNSTDPSSIVKEIAPLPENEVIEKDRPSAFFGTNLVSILNYYNLDTLLITGMSTSGCIRASVVDAFSYNYRVIVPRQCVADRSMTGHKASLFDIDMKYGDVLELPEVINYLQSL